MQARYLPINKVNKNNMKHATWIFTKYFAIPGSEVVRIAIVTAIIKN